MQCRVGLARVTTAFVMLAVVPLACRAEPEATARMNYSGTLVVGTDYVQALLTAPGDRACPPRIQVAGRCVRTPPIDDARCSKQPSCITSLGVSANNQLRAASAGGFVRVPWLSANTAENIRIEIDGCGGATTFAVNVLPIEPFAVASGELESGKARARWAPTDADQVCVLWRAPGAVEVCCHADTGVLNVQAPPSATDLRLSRGRLITTVGSVRIYRTSETRNLLTEQ